MNYNTATTTEQDKIVDADEILKGLDTDTLIGMLDYYRRSNDLDPVLSAAMYAATDCELQSRRVYILSELAG